MDQIPISNFKANCLVLLERVRKTGKPIMATRHGHPVAEVIPPSAPHERSQWIGSMKDSMEIVGDIMAPATDEDEWEALRD